MKAPINYGDLSINITYIKTTKKGGQIHRKKITITKHIEKQPFIGDNPQDVRKWSQRIDREIKHQYPTLIEWVVNNVVLIKNLGRTNYHVDEL